MTRRRTAGSRRDHRPHVRHAGRERTSAFAATQVFGRRGQTDEATVYVRYRNVIITAVIKGLDQTTGARSTAR